MVVRPLAIGVELDHRVEKPQRIRRITDARARCERDDLIVMHLEQRGRGCWFTDDGLRG
jgi:hypothetical protein